MIFRILIKILWSIQIVSKGSIKNDYVLVDGKIEGTLVGTNAVGGEIENPVIVDAKETKCSYMDVVTPKKCRNIIGGKSGSKRNYRYCR